MKKTALVLIFLLSHQSFAQRAKVDGILATVNSEPILKSDLKDLVKRAKQPGVLDEVLAPKGDLSNIQTDEKKQLEYLISEKVLESEIKRLNLSVTNERVEQEIRDTAKRSGMQRADLVRAVENQGIDFASYKNVIKQKIERTSLFESEIISKIRITDDEAFSEYQKRNPKAKSRVFEYTLSQIYFNPRKDGPETTMKRAEVVLQKIDSGLSFEKAVELHTEEKNVSNGGLLGTFKSGEFSSEFEEAVSSLSEGGHSRIVQSKSGFHILKLISKKMSTDPQFEKEKERIKAALFDINFKRQLKTWMESKREDAAIKYNER